MPGPLSPPFALTNNYFKNRLKEGDWQWIYEMLLDYFEGTHKTGKATNVVGFIAELDDPAADDCLAAFEALLKDRTELFYWLDKGRHRGPLFGVASDGTRVVFIFPVVAGYRDGTLSLPSRAVSAGCGDDYEHNRISTGKSVNVEAALTTAAEILETAKQFDTDCKKSGISIWQFVS